MPPCRPTPDHEVLIVGAGFSGIGMAARLKDAGVDDFLLVDDADGFGGTWYWNRYPGIAVDIPSFSYQYSFAKRTSWTRVYAPGDELRDYAETTARRYGLRRQSAVRDADHEGDVRRSSSRLGDRDRRRRADHGAPHDRRLRRADAAEAPGHRRARRFHRRDRAYGAVGSDRGAGRQAGRDHRHRRFGGAGHPVDRAGGRAPDRVPAHADLVSAEARRPDPDPGSQRARPRSRCGVQPRGSPARRSSSCRSRSRRTTTARLPLATAFERQARAYLKSEIPDPELRDKLTPRYGLGCKRPSFHNEYLSTFNRPNVLLETDPIDRITATGIRTQSGTEHEFDVLILATGFKVFDSGNFPKYPVTGRGGIDLEQWWAREPLPGLRGGERPRVPELLPHVRPVRLQRLVVLQPRRDPVAAHRPLPSPTRALTEQR